MRTLNKLLACAMALAVPLCTWAQTEVEPNNSYTQATPTAYNTAMAGSTGACAPTDNSADYFGFTPPAQGVLRIITSMSNSGATDLPVSVQLRQSNSSVLETFTVTAGANNVAAIDTVYRTCSGTGVYYINIVNPSGAVCTNYSFMYDVLDPVYANDTEPNDSYSQAVDTLPDGVNQEGHLGFFYDNYDDYFRILAPNDGVLNLTVSAEHAGTSTTDSITVYLRQVNSSVLTSWKVGVGANGVANTQLITRTCTGTEQVYFVELYSPSLCGISYQFSYSVTPPVYADDTEPNQSYTQHSVANVNTAYDGRVAFEYDNTYDYWQLQAPNDGLLTVTILAENASASTGTMDLYLRNASSSTLQTWTVNIGANGSPISNTFTRTCTGTENVYYLEPADPTVCGVSYRFNYMVTAPGFNDDAEPNDSYSQAVDTFAVNMNHDGRIGFEYDDIDDYYRILAPNDGVLNLTVSAEHAGTSTTDSITVYLRRASSSELTHWKVGVGANGVANTQQITRTCTGTEQVYFLEFYSPSLCGVSYQFNYTVTAPLYADDTEPNQSYTQHSVANANTDYDGRVSFEYDNTYDYWQLQAPNDGLLTVTILAENASTSTGTMDLYLRNASSSTLQTWTVNIGANGTPVSNTFTRTCTGTENVYYLEPADPTVCGVSYRFNYTVAAPLFADDVEPNNSYTQASLIDLDAASTFGRVSFQYDNNDDYFKVNHPGGVLRVITSAENAGAAGVMSVYLRNSSSSVILVNSAVLVGGNGVAAQDTTETTGPVAAGTYYIEVYSPSVCGVSYRLHCNDDDNDGVCNASDLCAATPTGEGVNVDGCSCSQVTVDDGDECTLDVCLNGDVTHTFQDADGDGTCDANDGCVNDPNKTAPGACGCGNPDVPTTWYADTDGDGFGDPNTSMVGFTCIQPPGYVADNTDLCDSDANKTTPGACGCGVADVATTWYADTDADGLGDPNNSQAGFTCIQPPGYVADNTDLCPSVTGTVGSACDDGNPNTTGDALDANCNCVGTPMGCDDGDPCTVDSWDGFQCVHTFQDADGDGTCDANDGCVNDPNKTAPGACGCGVVDVATTWYADTDGDGLGDPNNSQVGFTCIQPPGYVADNTDLCPSVTGTVGSACDDGNPNTTGDAIDASCTCVGTPNGGPCTGDQVVVNITTDGNPTDLSWQIHDGSNALVASGASTVANSLNSETACLNSAPASACYTFNLYDNFGDGITGGGWELRSTNGKLLLRDDFAAGSSSPTSPTASPSYGSGHSFCLPLGPANIAATECGIFNNQQGNKVYCNKVTGATQYQFEFSNPDAGFIRRIVRTTNYVHFWDMVANPLIPGVHYFARVRTNVSGPVASAHWGSGCEMGLAPLTPCSQLIPAPNYGHSCNETRAFNPPTNNSFIYAQPIVGATEYQFRIFNTSEGYDETFSRNTYILQLKWNNGVAPPLVNGSTYNVEINVKVNGVYSGFCASSCTITIDNGGNNNAFANMDQASFGEATLWPNPVRVGQVNLNIGGLLAGSPAGDPALTPQHITVDVQDIYGKQVFAQEYGNSGDRFSTILQLPGDIASGVYMVNITINGERTVQRLSVIR